MTGSTLNTKINNLSGYINSPNSNIVFTTGDQSISGIKTFNNDVVFTGTAIFNEIDLSDTDNILLSGVNIQIVSGSITLTNMPTISGNPLITGVDLSSYLTSSTASATYATITNLASTGSTLSTNLNTTGATLSNKIDSLSGSSVLLYGDQSIGGVKTFRDNVYINNLYVTGTETIVNTSQINLASNYLLLNITGGAVDGGIFFVTGSGLTGVNDTGPIIGFDHSNKFKFGVSTRNSDLSPLADIASVQQLVAYSGVADGKFATITNLASTGSTLDTKINNLSGVSVLTFGDQTINGLKTFTSGIDIYSGTSPQSLRIFNSTGTNSGEFALIGWRNNQFVIGSQNTNSGIFRDVLLTGNNINVNASGALIVNNINPIGDNNFIVKAGNGTNGLAFNPTAQGGAGLFGANWISTIGMMHQGDYDLELIYGGGGTRNITFKGGSTFVNRAILNSNGNFGIGSGISSVPSRFYVSGDSLLQGNLTVSGNTTITGHLSAASKSFLINHPTQVGKKLQYGSLESPYHGIRLTDKNKISADLVKVYLPEYISSLVNDEKVNIQLTNINHDKVLFVKEVDINENNFTVGMNRGWFDKNEYEFYWSFTAERKDIPKLTVEF